MIESLALEVCEFEATEDHNYNVGLTTYAVLATSATDTTGVDTTEKNGQNITDNMHHGRRVIVGTYVVGSANIGTRYVNVVGYAYSTAAETGHALTINQDYGRLSVLRFSRIPLKLNTDSADRERGFRRR